MRQDREKISEFEYIVMETIQQFIYYLKRYINSLQLV